MIKRSLLLSAMVGLGLFAVGCSEHVGGIVANAPAVTPDLTGRIPATGTYVLFRVDSSDPTTNKPTSVTQVVSFDLQEGDRVGFEWVPNAKTANGPDASMDLVAYAGTMRQDLGPIASLDQHYYWATKDGFNHYWSMEPANGFARRMTLQQ